MGLIIQGTIALGAEGEREGVAPPAPAATGDGKVQPGWPCLAADLTLEYIYIF